MQFLHDVCPNRSVYLPGMQRVHWEAPSAEKDPGKQSVHEDSRMLPGTGLDVPAVHATHANELLLPYEGL